MKIALSGLGVISAAGENCKQTLLNFNKKKNNAGEVTAFKTSLDYPVFEVKDLEYLSRFREQRTFSLLYAAVIEAIKDAKLEGEIHSYRVGVCLGTTVACQLNDIEFYKHFKKTQNVKIENVDRYLNGNLANVLQQTLQLKGPSLTVVNACSSGADAIGTAAYWIKSGLCDIAIAGGADEINLVPLSGFGALGVSSKMLCRPFDKNRSGLNLGEGAGITILESKEHADSRKHYPDIFLSSYSSAADAYHLTAPSPDGSGLKKALGSAMKNSGQGPENIGFINAHGTGTFENDKTEGRVFSEIFGSGTPFLSTKGYTGHTLGAAGGIEAVFTAMALKEGWIPKSAGFENFDEDVSLSPVTIKTCIRKNFAISTSLAFGGNNSVLIFERKIQKQEYMNDC